jgi:hypothetical protein
MRIEVRMAHFFGHSLFELFGDKVFEALGFVVQFTQGIAEHLEEKSLEEAVMANDLERPLTAELRETHTAVRLIFDERRRGEGQLLKHVGDGGRRYGKAVGQLLAADTALLVTTEGEDGFEVVVY